MSEQIPDDIIERASGYYVFTFFMIFLACRVQKRVYWNTAAAFYPARSAHTASTSFPNHYTHTQTSKQRQTHAIVQSRLAIKLIKSVHSHFYVESGPVHIRLPWDMDTSCIYE